ncbi:MAG: hypothetical protein AAF845_05740 [Bacteroidota bacterium]
MRRYTPQQFADRIAGDRLAREVERRFRRVTRAVRAAVTGDAIGRRMRDARSEPVRRDEDDSGPLRITSRPIRSGPVRYATAVRGSVRGSIDRVVNAGPLRLAYEMGVDARVVPQGLNERPGRTVGRPARPTFTASITAKARELRRLVRGAFVGSVRGLIR